MKKLLFFIGLFLLSFTSPLVANAPCNPAMQQGCCSWHGGVCGCAGGRVQCCDGTEVLAAAVS